MTTLFLDNSKVGLYRSPAARQCAHGWRNRESDQLRREDITRGALGAGMKAGDTLYALFRPEVQLDEAWS